MSQSNASALPGSLTLAAAAAAQAATTPPWPEGRRYDLDGMAIDVSAPVLVASRPMPLDVDLVTDRDLSGSYLWYPQVVLLPGGEVLAIIREAADNLEVDALAPIGFSWSSDGGRTWTPVLSTNRGQGYLSLVDHQGDLLHLPFMLSIGPDGVSGPLNIVPKGRREVRFIEHGVTISGWGGEPVPQGWLPDYDAQVCARLRFSGFYFNGQSVLARDGKTFLATLYGTYRGDQRCRIVCAESTDGRAWRIRSTIVDPSCALNDQPWSNSENAMVRLADGRLMCVFRVEGETYGRCFSSDDARTWTQPTALGMNAHAEPSLCVLGDGSVILAGGRPGLGLWFDREGKGARWQAIDAFAHHDSLLPAGEHFDPGKRFGGTSSYTEVVTLDATTALFIYDCFTRDHRFGIYVQRIVQRSTKR